MKTRTIRAMLILLFAMAIGRGAGANDGTPPAIFELVQQGRDVEVTVQIWETGEPGFEERYRLDRATEDVVNIVFDDKRFDPAEADRKDDGSCRWEMTMGDLCLYTSGADLDTDSDSDLDAGGDGEPSPHCDDCDDDGRFECFGQCEPSDQGADECVPCARGGCGRDCDGDGENDCYGWCQRAHYFTVVDSCVEVGEHDYQLSYYSQSSGEYRAVYKGSRSLVVEESDEECSGDPAETAGKSDSEADVGTDGCAVVTAGSKAPIYFSLIRVIFRSLTVPFLDLWDYAEGIGIWRCSVVSTNS